MFYLCVYLCFIDIYLCFRLFMYVSEIEVCFILCFICERKCYLGVGWCPPWLLQIRGGHCMHDWVRAVAPLASLGHHLVVTPL